MLGHRDAFLPGESQTISNQRSRCVNRSEHCCGGEKGFSYQLGEKEGKISSFFEKLENRLHIVCFGSLVIECLQNEPCSKDGSQYWQLVFSRSLKSVAQYFPLLRVSPHLVPLILIPQEAFSPIL